MIRRFRLYVFGVIICLTLPHFALAATFTVNSPEDTTDGICTNPFVNSANDCTIREAIVAANATSATDTITFAINGSFQSNSSYYTSNQYTLTAATAYNTVTQPVTISGVSSWDSNGNRPGIRLYSTTTAFNALTFNSGAANSKVQALEIQGFRNGLNIAANGVTIGTDCNGSNDNTERNVIHGATNIGVNVSMANTLIAGNYIGLDDDGITSDSILNSSITILGAAADNNIIGYRDSTSSCTAAEQRNVIAGATNTSSGAAVTVAGIGTLNFAGDGTLAPNGTVIAGNYLGVDATGTVPRGGVLGVYLAVNATTTTVGTDGDGINDNLESNVIYAAGTGVAVTQTGNNRISGNSIGVTPDRTHIIGTALVHGVNARGTNVIIGWCNTTVSASLCSDIGAAADEGNVVGGATNDGIRLGLNCDQCKVYGNWLGVGSDGITDLGNNNSGVYVHRSTTGNRIGGSGPKANTIQYNATGIIADGSFIGGNRGDATYQHTISDLVISGNTISQNDGDGVYLFWTNNYDTNPGVDITVENNTVNSNGRYGIEAVGSSPNIIANIIQANVSNGIELEPGLLYYSSINEATASNDPQYASVNLLAQPSITGNTISGNSTSGIAQLDTSASNTSTLYTDNTFSSSDSQVAISQSWYGAARVLTATSQTLSAAAQAGTTLTLTPVSGSSSSALVSVINLSDVATWFTLIDYTVSSNGIITEVNPYTVSASGTYTSQTPGQYTFDGSGGRFQLGQVLASTTPSTPTTITPTNNATGVSLTPTLQGSAFEDVDDTQSQATWQVFGSSAACSSGLTSQAILNITSSTALTSYVVPANILNGDTVYDWRVAYTNSFGNTSAYSNCAEFTTLSTTPERISDFPAESFAEDGSLDTGIHVNDYFTDAQGEALTYSATVTDSNLSVTIGLDQTITLWATADWFGQATVTLQACDPDGDCASGIMVVTVTPVNDAPTAPSEGFSPAGGDTSSSLQPTISWTAASDVDDATDTLSYQVKLGTDSDPVTNPLVTLQSDTGSSSLPITAALTDETTYNYAVRTVDAAGLKSNWSVVQTFVVNLSNTPELELTKTVAISSPQTALGSLRQAAFTLIQPVLATSTVSDKTITISNQIANESFRVLVGSLGLLLIAGLIVLILARHPKHFATALLHDVPIAYNRIHQPDLGTTTTSYTRFKQRLVIARFAIYLAIFIFVPAFVMNTLHAQVGDWLLQAQAASLTVQPGEVITVSIAYRNTGDGDATSAVLADTLPSGTSFLSSTVPATQQSDQVSFDLSTINAGTTGRVSYQLEVAEPYTQNTLQLDSAELTVNELTTVVLSNSITVPVVFATVSGQVTDSTGTGVTNVTISIQWGDQRTRTVTTNGNGNYSFSGLASGEYVVVADTQQKNTKLNRGDNTTVNFSFNTNTNTNTNISEPVNTNTPTNTNSNVTTNTNTSTPVTDTTNENIPVTIPDITLLPTNPDVAISTEQQNLVDSFVVTDLNGAVLPANQPVVYLTDDPSQAPVGALVLPNTTDTLTFHGNTLPNSKVTIQICYTILTTTSNETGAWIMVVPRAVLQQGENVITANITHGNVQVDQIVVAHVNVDNNLIVQPTNYWINFFAIIFLLQFDLAAWLILRFRHGDSTVAGKLLILHLVTLVVVVIFLSVAVPQSRLVQARSHLSDTTIVAKLINNQALTEDYITFQDARALEMIGFAAADQQYSVSLCPNQPFRYVTTNHNGQWRLILPVSVLPNHTVTVAMSPVTAVTQAGQPLVDINVLNLYNIVNRWRWILLALIASGAVITIVNWFIVYHQLPKRIPRSVIE